MTAPGIDTADDCPKTLSTIALDLEKLSSEVDSAIRNNEVL